MDAICKEHVIAIRTVYTVCRSFDSLLERTLGPNGKSTLLNTPTGQVLITNVGCTVLRCVNVEHPLGSMIIKSIVSHHSYAGDGSKTFVLYLTSIFSSIANSAEAGTHELEQRNSLAHAVHFIRSQFHNVLLPALQKYCCIVNICENKNVMTTLMHNIVKSHLCGKYTEAIRSHLSGLLVDFLCSGVTDFHSLSAEIAVCIDNFNLLCIDVDCMPPQSSCIYHGIVIQRDFLSVHHSPTESRETRFILLHDLFIKCGSESDVSSTFEAKDVASLDRAFGWKSWCSTALVDWLQKNNVNMILSAGSVDDSLQTLCAKAGISIVQFVDKEDFERLKMLFHITAIEFLSDFAKMESGDFIGCSEVCEAKVFGQKQFVCLKLPDHDYKSARHSCSLDQVHEKCLKRQLVICGMSASVCQQIRLDLLHALKTLRLWLDSKWLNNEESHCTAVHIAGGGSFELICYNALQDFMKQHALQINEHVTVCCEALCAALLAVPLRLLHNSFQPKLATVLYVKERFKSSAASGANTCGFDGFSGRQLQDDTTITEPVMSKILVIDHVLELTEQLLRINSVVRVKR